MVFRCIARDKISKTPFTAITEDGIWFKSVETGEPFRLCELQSLDRIR